KIDNRDRVVVAAAEDVTRSGVTIIIGALLLALVICLGWIRGLNSDSFFIKAASLSGEKVTSSANPPQASDKSPQGSSTNPNAIITIGLHDTSKRKTQTSESLLTKQPPAVERTKLSIDNH